MNHQSLLSASLIARLWKRIPTVVRAVVLGFLVFAIVGFLARTAILNFIPAPWSMVAMAIVLWIYVRYFSGSWWPKATTELRSVRFRATKLPLRVWKWSLIAALSAAAVLQSSLVITFRLIEFPAKAWALGHDFADAPAWQVWLLILMAALVAGITEEVGFRGYMQVPLEERFGPAVATTIVSLVFVVVHLNQAWSDGVYIILFIWSVLWGVLARVSDSLIPGMISHTVADIVNFSYWWTDVAGAFDKRPIGETGIDIHFIVWIAVLVVSLALFASAACTTLRVRRQLNSFAQRTPPTHGSKKPPVNLAVLILGSVLALVLNACDRTSEPPPVAITASGVASESPAWPTAPPAESKGTTHSGAVTLPASPKPTSRPLHPGTNTPTPSVAASELTSTPCAPPADTPRPTLAATGAPEIVSFSASPRPADPAGSVTLAWHARGASSVTVQWLDKQMERVAHSGLPLSGSLSVVVSQVRFTDGDTVQLSLTAHDANGQSMFDQDGNVIDNIIRVPLLTDMTIASVSASPDPVERGGTVTLTWNAPNAETVGITHLSPEGIFLPTEAPNLPASGSIGLQVPEDYATSITYFLGVRDSNGVMLDRYITVGIICPYEEYIAVSCPLERDYTSAAYEAFEGGQMVWRGDTREIYVLYNDGSYETYEDTWTEGEPIGIEETPPQGLLLPARGFGQLWWNQPAVRERLGWATAVEVGYTAVIETARTSLGRYPTTHTVFTLPDSQVVQFSDRYLTWSVLQ